MCDRLDEELAHCQMDLDDAKWARDRYKSELKGIEDDLVDVQEELDDLKSEHEDLEIERDEIATHRDELARELSEYDDDFVALQEERDDLKHQNEIIRAEAKVLVMRLEIEQKLHNETIAKLPRTADDATIFPGMTVYRMVQGPVGMWEAEHHTIEIGAQSLDVTKTCLFECYSHPQVGIDAKEGR